MVGVGGSIGTGILLGSGEAMQIAGPAAILSFAASANRLGSIETLIFRATLSQDQLRGAHGPDNKRYF